MIYFLLGFFQDMFPCYVSLWQISQCIYNELVNKHYFWVHLVIPSLTNEMLTDKLISMYYGVSVNINQVKESYDNISKSILYYINVGSRIILTNDTRCEYSQKEREFLELRDLFPKELKSLLP